MLSNRPVYGRTFHTAMWTIGLIAAVQLFAVIRAVMSRPAPAPVAAVPTGPVIFPRPFEQAPGTTAPESAPTVAPVVAPTVAPFVDVGGDGGDRGIISGEVATEPPAISPPVGESIPLEPPSEIDLRSLTPATGSGNPMPELSFIGPNDTAGPSLSESLTSAAFDAEEIQDPILERLVSAGEELRAAGNMQGALQALREAESALPEHPRILGEMAATFSQMGLDEKATVYWEKLSSLGSARGGAYYTLAERQLKGEQAPVEGASGQLMKIGEVLVNEEPPGEAGQKVSLRIVVDADPVNRLEGSELSVLVYFYDQVDGEKIDPSTADTSYEYPTPPYDWIEGGKEEIVVDYQQPAFSEEELRELGVRRYYGYVIELYYQDRLQDRIEMPEELSQFRMEAAPAPDPGRLGPENALFPEIPNF